MKTKKRREKKHFSQILITNFPCFLFSFGNLSMKDFFLVFKNKFIPREQFPPTGVHRLQSKASAASYLSKVKCTFAFHAYKCCNSPSLTFFFTLFHMQTQTHSHTYVLAFRPFHRSLYYTKCDNKSHNNNNKIQVRSQCTTIQTILICIEIFHLYELH